MICHCIQTTSRLRICSIKPSANAAILKDWYSIQIRDGNIRTKDMFHHSRIKALFNPCPEKETAMTTALSNHSSERLKTKSITAMRKTMDHLKNSPKHLMNTYTISTIKESNPKQNGCPLQFTEKHPLAFRFLKIYNPISINKLVPR